MCFDAFGYTYSWHEKVKIFNCCLIFFSALNVGQFIEAMTPKLINRDEDNEIRQTFMAFDTHCKFYFPHVLSLCMWLLFGFHRFLLPLFSSFFSIRLARAFGGFVMGSNFFLCFLIISQIEN